MTDRIQIIKHEAVPKCGSYEVRFFDGRPSKFFYWEDIPGRRLKSGQFDSKHTAIGSGRSTPPRGLLLNGNDVERGGLGLN
jgi:hypothetical protein